MSGNKNQMVQMLLWMTIAFCWMTVGSACSCVIPRDENYCSSDIVFRGRVVDEYPGDPLPSGRRTYVVEVDRIFWLNRHLAGRRFNLTTALTSAACGASFQLNTPYVIAAGERDGQLSTGLCSGNAAWNGLDEKRKLFFTNRLRKLCAFNKRLE